MTGSTELVTCLKSEGCGCCGKTLTGRQKRWCSPACMWEVYRNHRWSDARDEAMRRAARKCVGCGATAEEIDHIVPRRGQSLALWSCLHHQDNLRALCHDCHVNRARVFEEAMS